MYNNSVAKGQIEELLKKWADELANEDLEAMAKHYADESVIFDVKDHANGPQEYKKLWEQCLPYFDDIEIEYKDMQIHAEENMAFVFFLSRLKGFKETPNTDMANSWLRGTVCYRKIKGEWKSVHEHISFPVNCETEKIEYLLD